MWVEPNRSPVRERTGHDGVAERFVSTEDPRVMPGEERDLRFKRRSEGNDNREIDR